MKTVLDNIIVEFIGSYGAEVQAKKLGLIKKHGFGMYGPPGQNIATHKVVDNGGRLIKMGSSGVGSQLEEDDGDSQAASTAQQMGLEAKPGVNLYGPPGDNKATHKWDGQSMNPVQATDLQGPQDQEPEEPEADRATPDISPKIGPDDLAKAATEEPPEAQPTEEPPEGEPSELPPEISRKVDVAMGRLRRKLDAVGIHVGTVPGEGYQLEPGQIQQNTLADIRLTPTDKRFMQSLIAAKGKPVSRKELIDTPSKQKTDGPLTNREFNVRSNQWLRNMPSEAREYFMNRTDLSYTKFKALTKSSPNPERYLQFHDELSRVMRLANEGDQKSVQAFINKWGMTYEPKSRMYTDKGFHRSRGSGKVFDTGAAAYVADYLRERTGINLPERSNLDPFSVQALVPSNPDDLASSITTRDGHTVIKFGNRTISTIPMDSEKYANLSNEDKKNVRQHNMKMELMKNHLFKDGQLNGVVITPEEGKLELTKSLKETITNTNVLTDQGKRDSIQLIEDLESFDTMGLTTERIKDVFNEFEGKFHNAWLDGAANERAASNALTPLSEAFSTLRETMLGDTVIVPNDTNFPGTDIISIKFKDPNVASLIHVEVTPDITFGQVKRGSGAASSTLHKIDTTIFSDYGDMSGDSIHQALKNSIERTHQLLWSSNDVETAAAEFQQHFDTMWPLVAEQYGVHPDQKEKFLKLIQSGKVPVINRKGQVRLNKSPNVPLGSRRRHSGCKKLRQHWQIHNSVGVMNMMIYNKQKSRQAINLHSHVIGKGIVETNGKESMYNLSPHLDKGLRDNCTPGTKHASYSKVDTSMNENIMESIVAEFLMREKENNDGIFNSRSLKDLALHHNVSIRDMSLELLKATKIEKDKGKDIKTAMKFAFINLSENFRYYD